MKGIEYFAKDELRKLKLCISKLQTPFVNIYDAKYNFKNVINFPKGSGVG